MTPEELRPWRGYYIQQKALAKRKGIAFTVSFEDWLEVWQNSGLMHLRARSRRGAVMGRKDDAQPWCKDNLEVLEHWHNTSKRDYTTQQRAIRTPAGDFTSVTEAANYYGVTLSAIVQRTYRRSTGFYYL
jgi:hypothetical protein